jgi:hypothetical protein
MSTDLRSTLVDIAMEPDTNYRRKRNELAAAELAVSVIEQEYRSRLALAKAHLRHLQNEFTLLYGAHP